MIKKHISVGTVHRLPPDLQTMLTTTPKAHAVWEDITPLARNEWICWIEEAKKLETRAGRIRRAKENLTDGKRRPCCWIGCIHRTDKPVSPSIKGILAKRSKKK